MAAWLAPPPIQLPATVVNPLQISSGPVPANQSGFKLETIINAMGPPIIIPTVAVKNIINAFEPKFMIPLKSMLKHSKTKLAGSKYLDATKYNCD